jgi:hypothetical protein
MNSHTPEPTSPTSPVALDRLVRLLVFRAQGNLEKWGEQDFETLGLATAEETGELCQAILKARHEGGSPERIRHEAIDLGALCVQMLAHWPNAAGEQPRNNDEQ